MCSQTFQSQFFGHPLCFGLVHVYNGHSGSSLSESMGEGPADALTRPRHVRHLPVQTQPRQDRLPLRPPEHLVTHHRVLPAEMEGQMQVMVRLELRS